MRTLAFGVIWRTGWTWRWGWCPTRSRCEIDDFNPGDYPRGEVHRNRDLNRRLARPSAQTFELGGRLKTPFFDEQRRAAIRDAYRETEGATGVGRG